jgi:Glycosyl hydrolase family 26
MIEKRVARIAVSLLLLITAVTLGYAGVAAKTAAARPIAVGAYSPYASQWPKSIDRYGALVGRPPVIVSYYHQWDSDPFVPSELRAAWERSAVPMITWEPMSYRDRSFDLRAIARGRYDRYVKRAARAAAAWGKPILLRFAHEMNGNWYPWGAGLDGNTPHRYKAAWRRVVGIFRHAGADKVKWVWTPYANQFGGVPFQRFYPGDGWVDWVGLDGFNWGYGGQSYSFKQLFSGSYRVLARISRRPMMIGEVGTTDRGKAHWISQALRHQLPQLRRIKALVWFNDGDNGVDLRLNGSHSALRAFRSAVRTKRYSGTRESLLRLSPDRRER